MSALALSPQVFAILSNLIEVRSGLHHRFEDLELLRSKLSGRVEQLGFGSFIDYYYFLRYDPAGSAELDLLIEALVVHETYFFREVDQLHVLVGKLLANRFHGKGPVRIWCGASATGEEALTLAMLLAEAGRLSEAKILATDISERALARARRGEFGGRALRAIAGGEPNRWVRREADRVVVDPSLFGAIEWKRVNLIDPAAVSGLGQFDAVLARNVLIYFSDRTVLRVVKSLSEALLPGGYLCVGASESLLRYGTSLSCEEHGGTFFYRRVS